MAAGLKTTSPKPKNTLNRNQPSPGKPRVESNREVQKRPGHKVQGGLQVRWQSKQSGGAGRGARAHKRASDKEKENQARPRALSAKQLGRAQEVPALTLEGKRPGPSPGKPSVESKSRRQPPAGFGSAAPPRAERTRYGRGPRAQRATKKRRLQEASGREKRRAPSPWRAHVGSALQSEVWACGRSSVNLVGSSATLRRVGAKPSDM